MPSSWCEATCLQVRPLISTDIQQVAVIEASVPDGWGEGRLVGQLEGACAWQYVATEGVKNEIIGYVCGMAVADEAEVYRLVIRENCRRRGKGAALLSRLLDQLAGMGVNRVFLEVRESNYPALALYALYGFIEVGRRRAYYAAPVENAIIMERKNQKEIAREEHQGH